MLMVVWRPVSKIPMPNGSGVSQGKICKKVVAKIRASPSECQMQIYFCIHLLSLS
jgi:hypothetical protein